jgi:GxxExxY protein
LEEGLKHSDHSEHRVEESVQDNGSSADGLFAPLTEAIIGSAIEVHRALGPGLLESAYEACLAHELLSRGIMVQRQLSLPIVYKGQLVEVGYRIDMLVDDRVVVELKAVDKLIPIHEAQLMTHLRLSGKRVGLLINFNVRLLTSGVKRIVI